MNPALEVRASVAARKVDLDFQVPAGQVLAVLGENGAGKSTAVALAAGTLRPSEGTVRLDGRTVAGNGTWVPAHRRGISLMAQEPLLLPHLSVLENVAFGPRAQGQRRARAEQIAREYLAEVGAEHLADRRPQHLSGGQQQRVALARALAPEPQVLLLDEPLAALDIDAATELRQVLRHSLREADRTAVVITHDLLDVLGLADAVVVLHDGQVVESGPVSHVLTRPRSDFAARIAGVNLVIGTREQSDAVRVGEVLLHGLAHDDGAPGQAAAATFSPRAVAVHRDPPGGSPRNVINVEVLGLEELGELVRVRGRTGTGQRLAADVTAHALTALALVPGDDVVFVIKAAEVSIYPA